MAGPEFETDGQDQAEVYDETHLDDEGDGDLSFDEADDVLDVTQMDGDSDAEPFDEDDADLLETGGGAGVVVGDGLRQRVQLRVHFQECAVQVGDHCWRGDNLTHWFASHSAGLISSCAALLAFSRAFASLSARMRFNSFRHSSRCSSVSTSTSTVPSVISPRWN